jgi:hypothetical protein
MIDREKVIKALEVCSSISDGEECPKECPYRGQDMYCIGSSGLMLDAIDLLKEQKHSETFIVIDNKTGEEADTYDIALHEDWAKHLCYCDMEGWAIEEDGTLLLVDECGRFAYADRERFKVKWE